MNVNEFNNSQQQIPTNLAGVVKFWISPKEINKCSKVTIKMGLFNHLKTNKNVRSGNRCQLVVCNVTLQ